MQKSVQATMAEEVKLLGTWASPFSRRIETALKLKGVAYEYIEENLSNKSPLLLESNPVHKKIPVLIHNGKPIAESLVILEYIDETWKQNPLLPLDPYDRAMARFWAKFIDEKILPTSWKANTGTEEDKQQVFEELSHCFKLLENELQGKDFFGGQTIGFVDIVANIIAFWFPRVQEVVGGELITEEKFPLICRWIEKLLEIDVVNECRPPKEKHLQYLRARFQAMISTPK